MTSFAERKVQQFVDRLNDEAVVTRGNGKVEVDSIKIADIVRSDPKLAELMVKTYSSALPTTVPEIRLWLSATCVAPRPWQKAAERTSSRGIG